MTGINVMQTHNYNCMKKLAQRCLLAVKIKLDFEHTPMSKFTGSRYQNSTTREQIYHKETVSYAAFTILMLLAANTANPVTPAVDNLQQQQQFTYHRDKRNADS
jgi:hypothetical protein